MANVKTAISIEEPLFIQAEALAHEMKISRSRFFALAAEEFIRRHQNREMLQRIAEAYSDASDPEEEAWLRAARAIRGSCSTNCSTAGASPCLLAPASARATRERQSSMSGSRSRLPRRTCAKACAVFGGS